ncbi:carbohydrate deacetylase [Paenibacillus macerans]|uniref:YdjC-like family protein n=1 Tax=Paenibacillus macerans TaxID=44252 RepID=A0A090ZLN5_PAEMA|nr:ChbG/HpnK family deacetylase [Paenibacillus macerans]KFN11155.1 ydjC-like family protein [Paenibacillus macerans]MCY7560211.1 ChbG/HpnK family deacetylase [Paenibacillus macerans]MEC0151265.1 ChbG/HpnK family deacetylase [Paenibacillus macerans]SUD26832.1 YdjC family protein [Paenibacillus macerans]
MCNNFKKLIVNADDYGLTQSITEGILYAHQKGIITSTTTMMNQPYTEKALLKSLDYKELEVGVHLVFNKDDPLLSPNIVPSLVEKDGRFYIDAYKNREKIKPDHLFLEFCSQLDRFISITGTKPGHIDCHHWCYLHPSFFEVYLKTAKLYDIPARAPRIKTNKFSENSLQNLLGKVPVDGLETQLDILNKMLGEYKIICPDHFCANFYGDYVSIASLKSILNELSVGTTELMTHPGFIDSEVKEKTSYQDARLDELLILTSPEIIELIKENGIELVSFHSLKIRN